MTLDHETVQTIAICVTCCAGMFTFCVYGLAKLAVTGKTIFERQDLERRDEPRGMISIHRP